VGSYYAIAVERVSEAATCRIDMIDCSFIGIRFDNYVS
jgi:hypothetical protein